MTIDYPTTGNTVIPGGSLSAHPSGTFGNDDALVIRFTTPALGINDIAVFQPAGYAPTQNTTRVYTLATQPCQFATSNTPVGSIVDAVSSQSPAINIRLGVCTLPNPAYCPLYGTWLLPNTTYYVTMENRSGFGGAPSCSTDNCNMRIDFNL